MRNIIKYTLCIFGLIVFQFATLRSFCQDPQFSQFDENPLYLNPAATGELDGIRFGVNYRNQWLATPGLAFPGPLSSYDAYSDVQLNNLVVGGLGLYLMQDIEGEGRLKFTNVGFLYSWHLPTGTENFHMSFGTKLSYNFLAIDYSRLEFSDQIDPESGFIYPTQFQPGQVGNVQYFDLDAGIKMRANLARWWSLEVGYAGAHLVRPDVSLNGIQTLQPIKHTLHIKNSFALMEDKLFLIPRYLFQSQQDFQMHVFGASIYVTKSDYIWNRKVLTKPVYIGFYYRTRKFIPESNTNSIVVTLGHTGLMGKNHWNYQVGVSYDVDIKGLTFRPGGSLEFSFSVYIPSEATNILNKRKRWKLCPNFKGNPLSPL